VDKKLHYTINFSFANIQFGKELTRKVVSQRGRYSKIVAKMKSAYVGWNENGISKVF